MTVRECIDQVDALKPNQYSEEEKVRWIAALEWSIYNDIIVTHEQEEPIVYKHITIDDMDRTFIAPTPYDEVYKAYLIMKIDETNQETARYNNSATLYNSYFLEFAKYINKTRKPLGKEHFRFY